MNLQELIRNNGFKMHGEIVLTESVVLKLMSELQSDKETLLEALKELTYQLTGEQEAEDELEKSLGITLAMRVQQAKAAITKATNT